LCAASSNATGEDAIVGYRIDLVSPANNRPYAALDLENYGGGYVAGEFSQPEWRRTVRRFIPVLGQLPGIADDETYRLSARQIAMDVQNQFGITKPSHL